MFCLEIMLVGVVARGFARAAFTVIKAKIVHGSIFGVLAFISFQNSIHTWQQGKNCACFKVLYLCCWPKCSALAWCCSKVTFVFDPWYIMACIAHVVARLSWVISFAFFRRRSLTHADMLSVALRHYSLLWQVLEHHCVVDIIVAVVESSVCIGTSVEIVCHVYCLAELYGMTWYICDHDFNISCEQFVRSGHDRWTWSTWCLAGPNMFRT